MSNPVSPKVAPSSQRTAQNAMALAAATVLARGIQFLWILVLARLLDPDLYGLWGTISALLVIAATLPDFGIGLIVLRDIPQRPADSGRYLLASLVVQPVLALTAHLLVIGVGSLLADDAFTRVMIALAGSSLIIDALGNIAHSQLLAAERMVVTSTVGIAHGLLQVLFAAAVLLHGGGLPGLYLATILAGACRSALLWLILLRSDVRPVPPLDFRLLSRLLQQGFPIALNAFLSLVNQHFIRILIFVLLSRADAGYFTAAYAIIFGVVDLLNVTVLTALFPAMSRLAVTAPQALGLLTSRLALLTLMLTVPLGVGVSLLADDLTALLFPGFGGTARVLQTLIWFSVLTMVGNFFAQSLIIQRQQQRVLVIQASGLFLSLGLGILLLPRLGIGGAGLALLIAQGGVVAMLVLSHQYRTADMVALLRQAVRIGWAGGVMGVTILALQSIHVLVAGIVGAAAYGLAILGFQVLSIEDWQLLERAVVAMPLVGPYILHSRRGSRHPEVR